MRSEDPILEVNLYLRGDTLQPEFISRVMGIDPTLSQSKGGAVAGAKRAIAKIGMWSLRAKCTSPVIIEHIDELLKQLSRRKEPFSKINGVDEAYIDIFAAFDDERKPARSIALSFTPTYLKEFTRLGLTIKLTVV